MTRPLHPARDFRDDGASFRVRRQHFLNSIVIDQHRRHFSPWAAWTVRGMCFVLALGVIAFVALVATTAILAAFT